MKRKIEVCCTSVEDIMEAAAGGAVRVELCQAISCGGVTPGHGLICQAVRAAGEANAEAATPAPDSGGMRPMRPGNSPEYGRSIGKRIEVNVLIRPREGSFVYSAPEVGTMIEDIRFCREAGADGVVIGALTPDGDIDMEACARMMEAARGMSVTFHRAFDVCRNPELALEQVIGLGCDRLLSSGQRPSALDGAYLIARLARQAAGRITIMPGGGIRPSNIAEIERITGASEFHSTARAAVPDPCLHHVPALGFDEYAPDDHIMAAATAVQASCPAEPPHYILRTSRAIVRQLACL